MLTRFVPATCFSAVLSVTGLLLCAPCFGEDSASDEPIKYDENFSWRIRGQVSDEDGQPVVGAMVRTMAAWGRIRPFETKSRTGGLFQLEVKTPSNQLPAVLISDRDGKRAAYLTQWEVKPNKLFRVVLKPVRDVLIRVVDKQTQPVAGAEISIHATYTRIVGAQTDEHGEFRTTVPADAKIDWITARKSNVGFDYHENYEAWPTQERLPLPKEVTLTLSGVRPFRVKLVDTIGKPVSGVHVMPWTIRRIGRLAYVNLSGQLDLGRTNKEGVVDFDWLPDDIEQGLSFTVHHPDYSCPQLPQWRPGADPSGLTAKLLRNARVRGRVTLPDGRPAANIPLQGEGRGATNMYFRGHTRTGADGRYEMTIYPKQDTIIAVTANEWAARSHTGIKLDEAEVQEGVDFQLSQGTVVQGVVTLGPKKEPSVGETATLIQREGSQSLVRWSTTDDHGRYFFRVGPGDYTLKLPHQNFQERSALTVKGEKEIVRNGHAVRPERDRLTGKLVGPDGKLVQGGRVFGESSDAPGHAGFKVTVADDGSFATERWTDRMVLIGFNAERSLVGVSQIAEDTKDVTMKLEAGGRVTGRILGFEGKPLVNHPLMLTVKLDIKDARWFNIPQQTDGQGRYSVPAIVLNQDCEIMVLIDNRFHNGPKFNLKSTELKNLGEFQVNKVKER